MISKEIKPRQDGKSSAADSFGYGEGLKIDKETGKFLDKSHRTRLGGFGLVENGVYCDHGAEIMSKILDMAAAEMQSNCDLNTKVGASKKIAHFVFSYGQEKPSDSALRDTEDSTLTALKLDKNHFATFLHNDNGHWHLHIFASRIDKITHTGNSLWRDRTLRDGVCREIEIRHNLNRDNGLHEIDKNGKIIEVTLQERKARRIKKQEEKGSVSDSARKTEIYSCEKTFQTWCQEIRIGDRLKFAKSWQDLHTAAAEYGCAIKSKGAGFVISPIGEKGGIQLSKVGLKNLPARFGQFELAKPGKQSEKPQAEYKPEPSKLSGALYEQFQEAKSKYKTLKFDALSALREVIKRQRQTLRDSHKSEITEIKIKTSGLSRFAAISIAKMEHASALTQFSEDIRAERASLYKKLNSIDPGVTFRDYIQQQAQAGDDAALALAQQYGVDEATKVSIQSEIEKLKVVATISGKENKTTLRILIKHRIERNGTVIYNFGCGRTIIDSAVSKQIQLNEAAAIDPDVIETSLMFATAKFGNTLTLSGTPEFQRLAVETAVYKGLFIKFADPVLEKYRQDLAVATFQKEHQNVTCISTNPSRRNSPSNLRDSLLFMPERNLDASKKGVAPQMLLSKNAPDNLGGVHARIKNNHQLRRFDSSGSRAERPAAANHNATVSNIGAELGGDKRPAAKISIAVQPPIQESTLPLKQTSSPSIAQLVTQANILNGRNRNGR